ncbi:MAG: YcxB family protein [Pseudomonadales bacterium]
MSDLFHYSHTFTLTRDYLSECYDQSVVVDRSIVRYKRALITLVFGAALLLLELVTDSIAFFVLALGVLEVFATRYHKTWWLWRQMLGKSYKSTVTIDFDDKGVRTRSVHVDQHIAWADVTAVEETSAGFILRHDKGSNYVSKSTLDEAALAFLAARK